MKNNDVELLLAQAEELKKMRDLIDVLDFKIKIINEQLSEIVKLMNHYFT